MILDSYEELFHAYITSSDRNKRKILAFSFIEEYGKIKFNEMIENHFREMSINSRRIRVKK